MKILIISDAWHPQLNGVVRTYEYLAEELVKEGHEVKVIGPADFPLKIPMLGYAEIELVIGAYGRLAKMIDAEKAAAHSHRHRRTARPRRAEILRQEKNSLHHLLSHAIP
jgi:glycosyltransferase involved in cell wall biosynthesis